jgi:nucleoside-diphosphate-sugar epimerase
VRAHRCDLLDPAATEVVEEIGAEILVHAAWYAEPGRFWDAAMENLEWIEATLRTFRSFARAGGRRAVVVGSGAERAVEHGGRTNIYAAAKHASQVALDAAARELGVALCWARVFQPYGPGEPAARLVPSVIDAISDLRPAECTTGAQVCDFVFVDDVGRALALLAGGSGDAVVDVGTGVGTTVETVARTIAELLGHPELVDLGAVAARDDTTAALVADVASLEATIGWVPDTGVRDGLARTIEERIR